MPDELWMEVCDIVQKAVIKTIPKKKKCKMAKLLSEEGFRQQLFFLRKEEKLRTKEERKDTPI